MVNDEDMIVYMAIRRSFESVSIPGNSLNPGLNQFTPQLTGTYDLLKAAQAAIEALDKHREFKREQAAKAEAAKAKLTGAP